MEKKWNLFLSKLIVILVIMSFTSARAQDIFRPYQYVKKSKEAITTKAALADSLTDKSFLKRNGLSDSAVNLLNESFHLVGKKYKARDYWADSENLKGFSNLSLSSSEGGTLYTDLYTGKIGGLRIAFASAVTNSKNDTVATFQNFAQGGGNIILKAHLPFFFWQKKDHPALVNSTLFLAPRFGATLPALNQSLENPDLTVDLGVESHTYLSTENEQIALILKLRFAFAHLSEQISEKFTANQRKLLGYGQGDFGIILNKSYLIKFNFPISIVGNKNDPIDKLPLTVSLGLML